MDFLCSLIFCKSSVKAFAFSLSWYIQVNLDVEAELKINDYAHFSYYYVCNYVFC